MHTWGQMYLDLRQCLLSYDMLELLRGTGLLKILGHPQERHVPESEIYDSKRHNVRKFSSTYY